MMLTSEDCLSRVALVGFDGSTLRTLEYFFTTQRVGKQFQLVERHADADWVVFHADQPVSKDSLKEQLKEKIKLPAIVVSIKPLNWKGTVLVGKPFSAHDLELAIKKLMKMIAELETAGLSAASVKSIEPNESQTPVLESSSNSAKKQPKESVDEAIAEHQEVASNVASIKVAADKRQAIKAEEQALLEDAVKPSRIQLPSEARVASVRAQVVAKLSESQAKLKSTQSNAEVPSEAKKPSLVRVAEAQEVVAETLKTVPRPKAPEKSLHGAESSSQTTLKKAQKNTIKVAEKVPETDKVKPVRKVMAKSVPQSSAEKVPALKKTAESESVKVLQKAVEKAHAKNDNQKPSRTVKTTTYLNMGTVFGHLPELNWHDPADKRRLSLSLEGMLLPWVEKAVEEGRSKQCSVAIDGLHLRLEYLPWTDCFVTNLSEEVLYTVMTSRFGMGELSIRPGDVIEDDLQEGLGFSERVINATDLLWLAGLWTAQGRLLPNIDPTKKRILNSVPDCIKLIAVPEVHAIIDLWVTSKMSAFEVMDTLSLPQRYVFGVLGAASTAKLFTMNHS